MRIRFVIPQIQTEPQGRPKRCPYCGQRRPYRHRPVPKPLKDQRYPQVQAIRYQCRACHRTFRHYPQGVNRAQQSASTKTMSVLLWVLGLSLDNVSAFLRALGCGIAKSTAWENLQAAGEKAQELRKRRPSGRVKLRVIGADTTVCKIKGEEVTTGMVTDGESGAVLEVEILEGEDEEGLKAWLGDLVEELGVEVLVSDDDDAFKGVAADLGLQHQVCIAHVRRWVGRRTGELIAEAEGLLARKDAKDSNSDPDSEPERPRGDPQELIEDSLLVKELVGELAERGPPELERLHLKYVWAKPPGKGERASLWYRMPMLTLRLWENWKRLVLFQTEEGAGLDGTNNVTERAIGRCGKVRYRMMRGYKSRRSWKLTHELFAWLGEEGNGYRLGKVIG